VITVWLEGSILGTLLNYLVDKDPVTQVIHHLPASVGIGSHDKQATFYTKLQRQAQLG
jgi:hypothetical protein